MTFSNLNDQRFTFVMKIAWSVCTISQCNQES